MQVVYVDTDGYRFSRPEKIGISRVIQRAYRDVQRWLPQLNDHLTVVVEPAGDVSYIYSPYIIMVKVDPRPAEDSTGPSAKLAPVMWHEFNHIARLRALTRPIDVLELAVFEGLAVTFQRDYAGDPTPLADHADVPIEEWLDDLRQAAHNPSAGQHQDWFIKHPDGREWIGYRVGTYLVDLAQRNNPNAQPADLVGLTTEQTLDLAGV